MKKTRKVERPLLTLRKLELAHERLRGRLDHAKTQQLLLVRKISKMYKQNKKLVNDIVSLRRVGYE